MNRPFGFSGDLREPRPRNVEDAPADMRQQLLDAIYQSANVADFNYERMSVDDDLYFIVSQTLGVAPAGNPPAGRRQRMSRDFDQCADWKLIYDVIVRLWPEFLNRGRYDVYRAKVNRVLAVHGIAWDLGADGQMHRVLPKAAEAQVSAMFEELRKPGFEAAQQLAQDAGEAFDARPRRARDALANVFDAMESVAKTRLGGGLRTFGEVIAELRRRNTLSDGVVDILQGLNTTRNRNYGHGNEAPFTMSDAEVDFAYLACVGGILMFARLQ